jgi:predicted transposase/invertase (TIGR01784 family)
MSSKPSLKPHDRYFRAVLAQQKIIRDFLEKALPVPILNLMDLETLELRPESYVDDHLKLGVTDLLFSAQFQGKTGFIYILLEHASKPDPLLSFRMLKYRMNIMDDLLKKGTALRKSANVSSTKLPLIIPLVLYTGPTKFPYSMDLVDLFDCDKRIAQELWEKPCRLIDLSQLSLEDLKQYSWFKAAATAAKYVHQLGSKDFLDFLSLILDELQILDALKERWYIEITLKYIAVAGKISDKDGFVKAIQEKLSEELTVNLLKEFEKDGFQKGKLEGKLEGIQQGLEKGKLEGKLEGIQQEKLNLALKLISDEVPLEQVSHWTGLSVSQVEGLLKQKSH